MARVLYRTVQTRFVCFALWLAARSKQAAVSYKYIVPRATGGRRRAHPVPWLFIVIDQFHGCKAPFAL